MKKDKAMINQMKSSLRTFEQLSLAILHAMTGISVAIDNLEFVERSKNSGSSILKKRGRPKGSKNKPKVKK